MRDGQAPFPGSRSRFRVGALCWSLAVAGLVAATAAVAQAPPAPLSHGAGPTHLFVTIEGARQGKFKADGGPRGGDRIPALRFQYQLSAPRDAATGQASGKRQHGALMITKEWSAASPQIYQALVTNETLKSVLLEFFRPGPSGAEEVLATIHLTNATVASMRTTLGEQVPNDPTLGRLVEEVSFTFQRIELQHPVGKTMAFDDWRP